MKLDMEAESPRRPFGLHNRPDIGSIVTIVEMSMFGTIEHPSLFSGRQTIQPQRASTLSAWRPNPASTSSSPISQNSMPSDTKSLHIDDVFLAVTREICKRSRDQMARHSAMDYAYDLERRHTR